MLDRDWAVDRADDIGIGSTDPEEATTSDWPLLLTVFPVPALSAFCVFTMLNGIPDWMLVRSRSATPRAGMRQPGLRKEGQIVDQAQFDHVALVEVELARLPCGL